MTIHLPKDLESSIRAEVLSGHFASEAALVAAAVRDYLQRKQQPPRKAMTLDELHRQMLADGLITQLPNTAEDFDDEDDAPIAIEGEPLSETIIRERR